MFYPNLKHFKCRFTESTGIRPEIFHRSSINGKKNPGFIPGILHILLKMPIENTTFYRLYLHVTNTPWYTPYMIKAKLHVLHVI